MNTLNSFMKVLCTLFLICSARAPVLGQFAGGTGRPNDPYHVATAKQLISIGLDQTLQDKHFIMVNNIDLNPDLPESQVFEGPVIPEFSGTFNGNGLKIHNLIILASHGTLGLFGRLQQGGQIKSLYVVDINVTSADDYVGGLVGYNQGLVAKCYSTGMILGGNNIGGLVGRNEGKITSCYSTCTVSGRGHIGGMLGSNYLNGDVNNCYSAGIVSGERKVGGLVGLGGYVSNCYSTSIVSGEIQVGGLVGISSGGVNYSFWDMEFSEQAHSSGGLGLSTVQMMDPQIIGLIIGWSGNPNWIMGKDRDYPRLAWEGTPGQRIPEPTIDWLDGMGTPDDPYRIVNTDQLALLNKASILWNKCFILCADIDLVGRAWSMAVIPMFSGRFDGDGYTISNLRVSGESYLGLFGEVKCGGQVKNLSVRNANITGTGDYIAGTRHYIGILIGDNSGTVINCHSSGNVHVQEGDCRNVGGLIGKNGGNVVNCYSRGTVSGGLSSIGGLVGSNDGGNVTNCYSTVTVSGDSRAGGLVGSNQNGDMTNCYSIGRVSDDYLTGGLVGYNSGNGDVTNCFWDMQTSWMTRSACGEGLSTTAMQNIQTFLNAGWDFVGETQNGGHEAWQMPDGGGYPILCRPSQLSGQGNFRGPYLITTARELGAVYLDPSASYKLAAFIDMSDITWSLPVIPEFSGTFDGNDYAISNLRVAGKNNLGLFGLISAGAEVYDLAVVDVNVTGWENVGGLAGSNMGSVYSCYSSGIISGRFRGSGGLVGSNKGLLVNCDTNGVSGCSGLAGVVEGGMLINCVANDISAGKKLVWNVDGGILINCTLTGGAGLTEDVDRGMLVNCYATGVVSSYGGGLARRISSSSLFNCHSSGEVAGRNKTGGLVGQSDWSVVSNCSSISSISAPVGFSVGGLVGECNGSILSNCYSSGSVGGHGDVGGLVGEILNGGIVDSCYSECVVSCGPYTTCLGGLVGTNDDGYISNCYSRGSVSCSYSSGGIGGLVGSNGGYISNCYSTGELPKGKVDSENIGGLIGGTWSGSVNHSYWDVNTSGVGRSDGGIGLPTERMQDVNTYLEAGWDFADETENGTKDTWQMPDHGGYPVLSPCIGYTPIELTGHGTADDPYLISTASELATVYYEPTASYRLTASIDLTDITWPHAVIPVFAGVFDGNGFTIRGLTISGKSDLGLFGAIVSEGHVCDLGLTDVNVSSIGPNMENVGGLAGRNSGEIVNCYSTGTVSGDDYVGGLVGTISYGSVTDCYFTGMVSGGWLVGGLVGEIDDGIVSNCYSSGTVFGDNYVGGLVGRNYGHVNSCYSTVAVSGDNFFVGGLVGSGNTFAAVNCFWDVITSGINKSAGGDGLITTQMKDINTYLDAGWDFMNETGNGAEDIWWMPEDDYPRLSWGLTE